MRMKKLNLYKLDVPSEVKKAPANSTETIDASEKNIRICTENGDEPVPKKNKRHLERV
jgi:hypothetical protein